MQKKTQVLTEQNNYLFINMNVVFFCQLLLAAIVVVKRRMTDQAPDNSVIRAINAVIM